MFRKLFLTIAAVAVFGAPITTLAVSRITVPGGTPVKLRMVDTVDSGSANVGDTFEFKADDNVIVNDYIVVARGAAGRGTVTAVSRAGSHGHPGSLGIRLDYVYAVDGEKIRLATENKNMTGEQRKGASSTATIIGFATLGIGGLFAHNFVKGKNITLDPTKPYEAYVDTTVHIASNVRAPADSGYAQ